MSYVLYGNRRSGSSTVQLALAEIGASYEVRDVNLDTDQQRGSDYAAVNPQRKVPTLITPAGETITESVAILLTLDERHPDAGLMPERGTVSRAQALRWLLFVSIEIYPTVEIEDYPERFIADPAQAETTREIARDICRRRWLIVERQVTGNPYLLNDGFCLTDIYIAVVSRWEQQEEWRSANLPKIERLAAAVAGRPACAPVWRQHFSEP